MEMDINGIPMEEKTEAPQLPIGSEQLLEFTRTLERYNGGLKLTKDRIVSSENWWKLRNTREAAKVTEQGKDGGFTSQSGWLHNVITSKHADAMDAYPAPVLLPREAGDKPEAKMLSAILPCVLEQNDFEEEYSDAMWQKTKTGTAAYKIIWDTRKLNGLGDISITCVNLLDLYWQPEVKDIQKSRFFFHVEMMDKAVLIEEHPNLETKLKGQDFLNVKFQNDETDNDAADKAAVIEVYYHKRVNGRNTLQYCKYVGDNVLFATENMVDPEIDPATGAVVKEALAITGLYDHGLYPFVFDPLFPVEGSPCGYGYVDVCRNPQIVIDSLKTSFVKNAKVGATPRYFSRAEGNVNEEDFLDLSKPLINISGNLDEQSLRPVEFNPLPPVYVNVMQDTVQELRETSGNTETSTGNISSGVTAAAAIAALQEASGKGSRDASRGSYRAFSKIIYFSVELIRQFYDLPRKFRILGDNGAEDFVSYTNENIKPQHQGMDFGEDMGYRLPVFDIQITAQKKNAYSAMAQNELALQLYQMGMFQPQMAEQSLICLDMMDFEGKEELKQKISQNTMIAQKLMAYMQMVMQIADPVTAKGAAVDMAQTFGMDPSAVAGQVQQPGNPNAERSDVRASRERAATAAEP